MTYANPTSAPLRSLPRHFGGKLVSGVIQKWEVQRNLPGGHGRVADTSKRETLIRARPEAMSVQALPDRTREEHNGSARVARVRPEPNPPCGKEAGGEVHEQGRP